MVSRRIRRALSKSLAIAIAVVIIIAVIGAILLLTTGKPATTTSPTPTLSPTPTSPSPTPTTSPSPSPTPTPTSSPSPTPSTTPSPTPTSTPTPTTSPSPSPTPTSPKPKKIVLRVITRHPYDILDVAKRKFLQSELAKKYGIVNIMWLPVEPTEWTLILSQTQKDPAKAICVAWGGGPTLFDELALDGWLAPLTSPLIKEVLKDIPKEIAGSPMIRKDKEGNIIWIAAAIASFGITVNKPVLEKYGFSISDVDEWKDLASPYFGVIEPPILGVADATRSTSNTRMYEIILQRYGWVEGWKIITLMGANSRIYDASGLVRDAVIRGDIAAGITIDFYGYTAQLQNPNTRYLIPKDGSIVNGDPIAMLKGCPYPEAAQAFIAWVLSPEGQTVWMDPNVNRMPVNPKVFEVTEEGKKRTDLKEAYEKTLKATSIKFSDELALSYEEAMRWFFHATITRAQEELREAWKAIAMAYIQGKINDKQLKKLIDELANPLKIKFKDPKTGKELVFSQEVAQYINKLIRNPKYKMELVKEWTEAAKERYKKALELLRSMIGG